MSTTLEQVRALTSDKYQYDRAEQLGDGFSTDYGLPNPPIRSGSLRVYVAGALQVETTQYTVDLETGLVVFVAPPALDVEVVFSYQWSLLSDGDVAIFLELNADQALFAASDALNTMATNEALVQKVIEVLDLKVDGAKVADSLRQHAKDLYEQAVSGIPNAVDDPGFDVAEEVHDPFSWRERLTAEWLRTSGG